MGNIKQTADEYFKATVIVFFALLFGQALFALLSFYLVSSDTYKTANEDLRMALIYLIPAFVLAGFISSSLVFRNRLRAIDKKSDIIFKLTDYRNALLIRYALLEGPSFFAIVAYMLTGDIIFIILAGFVILYFVTLMPKRGKAARDLDLSPDEEHFFID